MTAHYNLYLRHGRLGLIEIFPLIIKVILYVTKGFLLVIKCFPLVTKVFLLAQGLPFGHHGLNTPTLEL